MFHTPHWSLERGKAPTWDEETQPDGGSVQAVMCTYEFSPHLSAVIFN